ncbi:MAG TPA: class I SAM-dependent methyltransferase [Puia sp.]|jgi:2-polyprenyl-3-methyl-5-hydroxy-6-metoxy-1,4-benzoquinol methylase|nr:class I SAM-dependent methyltransferase [Puia sp.]
MITGTHSDPIGFETLEIFSGTSAINQWLYDNIKKFASGKILEIGSGIGNISAHLLRDHTDVSLSDLRPEYCALLRKKFGKDLHLQQVYELDLSLSDFKNKYVDLLEKFDTVIALNVIEHIENDSLAIQNAKSLLRRNGKLVILVPAGQSLYNTLDKELGHYKRYSKTGLKNLLRTAGFEISYCSYFNAAGILGWWLSGTVFHDKVITSSKLHLFNQLVPVFRILDWFITPVTGVSVISAGIKN